MVHKTYVHQTVHQTIINATEILNILVISISQVSQRRLYMSNRDYGIKQFTFIGLHIYIERFVSKLILNVQSFFYISFW